MRNSPSRRTVLRTASLGGVGVIAGCLGAAESDGTDTPEPTDTPTETEDAPASDPDEWLHHANRPTGETQDRRFDDEVEVSVGSPNVPYAFAPAILTVSPGTTVTWMWTHGVDADNVVALDGSFDSGEPVSSRGETFSHTFEETGTIRYVSEPKTDCGMRGLVRVEEVPETGYPTVDRWLVDAAGYDGRIVDETGSVQPTVRVGTPSENGNFAFDPPAIKVEAGTTVVWEWTGDGGAHDVAFVDGDVQSELVADGDQQFSRTFDEQGVYRYACRPHEAIGQKGAIVVE